MWMNPIYADTDSVDEYAKSDAIATKQILNTVYGKEVQTSMCRNYICVKVGGTPVVIFKSKIVAVEKRGEKATIRCTFDLDFDTDNKYADVVKMLL